MGKTTKLLIATAYSAILPLVLKKPYRIVLCYHGVREQDVEGFEKQMGWLTNKCKVVRISEILTAEPDNFDAIAAITFDDAFVNLLKNALPVLRKYGLTASIFAPAGNLAQTPKWCIPESSSDRDEMVMSKEQLAEIDKEGFEILSHTASHPVLTEIDDSALSSELSESKLALEKIVGREVSGIAYPHGAYDSRVCAAAREAGYQLGCTIEPRVVNGDTDSMEIGRVVVSPSDGLFEFGLKVGGAYQAMSYLRTIRDKFLRRRR